MGMASSLSQVYKTPTHLRLGGVKFQPTFKKYFIFLNIILTSSSFPLTTAECDRATNELDQENTALEDAMRKDRQPTAL